MIDREIINEIYKAIEILGGESDILSTIGSYGETLPDEEVLSCLRAWNTTHGSKSDSSESHLDYSLVEKT